MSIRIFIAVLLTGVFVLSVGSIIAVGTFLEARILPLIADISANAALSSLILQASVLMFAVAIGLLIFVFVVMGRFIAKPIRRITEAMKIFADTGERSDMPSIGWAPKEVRTLTDAFLTFAARVEEVHKHDVEISRVKSDFISTAAHQLRTPLTGIRWALEALQMENLTESQKALVASATEKSKQLVAVVGTLLDISSIESGKYKYTFEVLSLDSVLSEVAKDFVPHATKTNVSFLYEKSAQANLMVKIDKERIRWVLNNLVENAIRYTPAGGSVRITTEAAPGRVYVRVRDTGIGISQADRGNIFERFYRAPNAIAKENAGNGLGLYIARTIANDHGGDLNFESNGNGPGTTFTLSLPLAA